MRKIPEAFELTEEDISDAITCWLNQNLYCDCDDDNFQVSFVIQEKVISPGTGMQDSVVKTIISALATKL